MNMHIQVGGGGGRDPLESSAAPRQGIQKSAPQKVYPSLGPQQPLYS